LALGLSVTLHAPELRYFTAADGYRFAIRVWERPAAVGRIVVIHGIISHGGWYLSSCRHLAENGFEVHALDRRGSGLNLAARGDVPSYETWLTDVESYVTSLASGVPTVLAGISWGGKFVAALAKRNLPDLAGVAMICPGLFARQQANVVQRSLLQAAGLAGLAGLRIAIPLRDPALFTDTARWCDYIRDDPLTLRRVTIRFALADLKLNDDARAAPEQIRVPALLMLAGRERIVDNPRTRDFFRRISSPDKTELEYLAAGHTLEFEPDTAGYLGDLRNWVARVTGA
jgi:alpha-beta hydrolase superfamily lysophospholipase